MPFMSEGGGARVGFDEALKKFPFCDDFGAVVRGDVDVKYLGLVAEVLEPVVDVIMSSGQEVAPTAGVISTFLYASAALARVRVVQAFGEEFAERELYADGDLEEAMCEEWRAVCEDSEIVLVEYSSAVGEFIGEEVASLWRTTAVRDMVPLCELSSSFEAVSQLRFASVGQVLVQSEVGKLARDLSESDKLKPVLPLPVYRSLMSCVKRAAVRVDVLRVDDAVACCESFDFGGFSGVSVGAVQSWFWLLLTNIRSAHGFCYQLWFRPLDRFAVCRKLGPLPYVAEVLWCRDEFGGTWASTASDTEVCDVVHVKEPGEVNVDVLFEHAALRVGMDVSQRDYFAEKLVDEFISKRKKPVLEVLPPVDRVFEGLTITAPVPGADSFHDLARKHYAGVDEMVSPRAAADSSEYQQASRRRDSGVGRVPHQRGGRGDTQRRLELASRLESGAVISEDYFKHSYSRFARTLARPRLGEVTGRSFHLFGAVKADEGVGLGPWELDTQLDVPGWTSYVAQFPAGAIFNLGFRPPESLIDGVDRYHDMRMDCTGSGVLEFGVCKVVASGTVLWFSDSIRFELQTRERVDLRISVPDSGAAGAFPVDMRRYMRIPGYTVVARSHEIHVRRPDKILRVERARHSRTPVQAGCHLYTGVVNLQSGKTIMGLSGFASAAAARLLIKANTLEALDFVSVSGMRVRTRARSYVSVLVDLHNLDLYISMASAAPVTISVLQVVNEREYDLAVSAAASCGSVSSEVFSGRSSLQDDSSDFF